MWKVAIKCQKGKITNIRQNTRMSIHMIVSILFSNNIEARLMVKGK